MEALSIFQKLEFETDEFLDELIDELLDQDFSKSLAFEPVLDDVEEENPHILMYVEQAGGEDDPFFSLFFDRHTKEVYFWKEVQLGSLEVEAKIYIENMEELSQIINYELES